MDCWLWCLSQARRALGKEFVDSSIAALGEMEASVSGVQENVQGHCSKVAGHVTGNGPTAQVYEYVL